MDKSEEKNLKTQLILCNEIREIDKMILFEVQLSAQDVLSNIIAPKVYMKSDQETVELTVEEFTKLRLLLARLSSDKGLLELNSHMKEKYIEPKKEKVRILDLLR